MLQNSERMNYEADDDKFVGWQVALMVFVASAKSNDKPKPGQLIVKALLIDISAQTRMQSDAFGVYDLQG